MLKNRVGLGCGFRLIRLLIILRRRKGFSGLGHYNLDNHLWSRGNVINDLADLHRWLLRGAVGFNRSRGSRAMSLPVRKRADDDADADRPYHELVECNVNP